MIERGAPVAIRPGPTHQKVVRTTARTVSPSVVIDGGDDDGRQVRVTLSEAELDRLRAAGES